jgi:hypothetical protein
MMLLRKGQNLVDVAIIIGAVGILVIGMGVYVRRSVQGKVKNLTDYIISSDQAADEDDRPKTSKFTMTSKMTAGEKKGGSRSFEGTENSTETYTYSPKK